MKSNPKPSNVPRCVCVVRAGVILGTLIAFFTMASPMFAANPFEEMGKNDATVSTTGGVDPHGDSLQSIQHSLQQFAHPTFLLRLFLSISLALACAWAISWRPRRWTVLDPIASLEERNALVILGMVGAIIAELSQTSHTLAFVIFGIGALLRFRTVLDNPKATVKAILVVVIGLACGLGSWTMAVFVTAISCLLLLSLDSYVTGSLTVRLAGTEDPKSIHGLVQSSLTPHRCRVHDYVVSKGNKRMDVVFRMPAGVDRDKLQGDVRSNLPKNGDYRVSLQIL